MNKWTSKKCSGDESPAYIFISHNDAFTKWTNLIKSPAPWSPSYLMTTLSTFVIRTDLHNQKHAICSKSAAGLLPCCHQADIRMRSHRLLRLDDNKSAASCQQAWCKLIVKTFYPQSLMRAVSTTFSKSPAGLLPCSHHADIRMRSHHLLWLDDNKSAASCQQVWCKLIVKIFYPQAWCKLFQQLATSLQISAIWWIQQTCYNLMTTCVKPVKSTTCSKSVAFLVVYMIPLIRDKMRGGTILMYWNKSRLVTQQNITILLGVDYTILGNQRMLKQQQ